VQYRSHDQVGVVGLAADGQKRVVSFTEGSTADPVAMDTLVRELERRTPSPRLCITDGGGALDREIADSFPTCLVAHADVIQDPTVADAMPDRTMHHAYRITMEGESMRRVRDRVADVTMDAD
jgi:hypothetical protein